MQDAAFKIYNASAGSGKTFTLVKEYLKIVLSSETGYAFQQVLAVTFTNKAVNEMKQRILDNLDEIIRAKETDKPSEMARQLVDELKINHEQLKTRARLALNLILHNYAYFDISTIDKFTHRVIRCFARDLKISQNFEVVLDTDKLLEEAVGNLLDRAGENDQLTKVLTEFALEKTDEDKHWDISLDLFTTGKILFRENELPHLKTLEDKELNDFKTLQKTIIAKSELIKSEVGSLASEVLDLIEETGLTDEDFPRKTLPSHFKKVRDLQQSADSYYNNKLEETLRSGNIVKKGVEVGDPDLADKILSKYLQIKSRVYERALLQNAYQNLVPLTVINSLYQELKEIEMSRDLLPISSFNTIISEAIANQPAPFIYERLGEKYRHYFIDEFQDTSTMQWKNLVPLVSNALEGADEDGKNGSLLIVGDVKQAIYRWRGGKAEQFMGLVSAEENPFVVAAETYSLDTNYRSSEEIINFNNSFFKSTSSLIQNETYRRLFSDETHQHKNFRKGGLVRLQFLDKAHEEAESAYLKYTGDAIDEALASGYNYSDIAILTRKRDQGVSISEGLIEQGIPVVSSETLLLKSSAKVSFLVELMKVASQPSDLNARFLVLDQLVDGGPQYHKTIKSALNDIDTWLRENWKFDIDRFRFQSLYDGLEEAIKIFELVDGSDAFINFFMDEVLKLELESDTGIAVFLEHWEKNKEKLSITAPAELDAVKIMTIHKAKGLEFPIVIYPYANTDIYHQLDPRLWIKSDPAEFNGFRELRIKKKKELLESGDEAQLLFEQDHHKLELDSFNLLYVALTRAVDALYVISEREVNKNGEHNTNHYSGLFIQYLIELGLWQDDKLVYSFGELNENTADEKKGSVQGVFQYLYSNKAGSSIRTVVKGGVLWDTDRAAAIERGNLLHYILSLIEYESDIEPVLSQLKESGELASDDFEEVSEILNRLVKHGELKKYFNDFTDVKNEQEIILENGIILRPDRLVFENLKVSVIDYKTGARRVEHRDQIITYGEALKNMGFTVEDLIVVYLNDTINAEFIN